MKRASNNRRTWPAALLLWGLLCLAQVGLAHAQDTFGDINGDGKVSVVDVGYAQLFALGKLTPTAEQIDTANVFPMISPTGCGPALDAACIDFANRDTGGEGPGPDAGDITVADVGIIQLVALGLIKMPPRLGISSVVAVPAQSRLNGMTSTGMQAFFEVNGSGFQTENVRITMGFPEDAGETIVCTIATSPTFPIVCTDANAGCSGELRIESAGDLTTNLIRLTAPEVFCHDAAPADGTVSATLKVENLDGALQPLGEANSPDPLIFADSAFQLTVVSGNGQGGFPLIDLSKPLVVRASDLMSNPVTSLATGMSIEFAVTSNQGASLNGEGEILQVDLDSSGLASINVTPFPAPAGGGDLVIEATLVNLFGETQVTGGPAIFTIEMAASGELLLRPVSAPTLCAAGEVCPDSSATAQTIGVELIDRFGARVGDSLSYLFTETGASANISAAGVLPSLTCTGGTPCTVGNGFAEVGVMAGVLDPGENLGSHTITVTTSGAPATVLPSGGVSFDIEVQRPVGTDVVLVDPALQAERSVSRADAPTPCLDASMMPAVCGLDVVVLDQFGRGINGEEVTFSVTRSIQVTDVLNPGGVQTIMVSTATSEMQDGRAAAVLSLNGTGSGGQIDVRASIAAATDLNDGDAEVFLFSVGALNPPPPSVNMSLVEVVAPVNNAITTFADGTKATDLVIRGSLGSVMRSAGDDISLYYVQLTIGGGAPLETIVTSGLPAGLGSPSDADRGRFQFQIGSYQPGAVATLRVADGALAGSPDVSLARTFILPGVPAGGKLRGFATDRTESQVRVFDVDPTDVAGTFEEIDSNATLGIQGIVISGETPNDVVYFDTDPMSDGVDRALVLNQGSKDISVLRIAEEILIQGNDLALMGEPSAIVTSTGANFIYGKINPMTGGSRNYNCNPGVGSNFVHNQNDDCAVSVGDKLIIDPEGANPITRTIVEIIDYQTLRLAGELTSQQVPGGGVDFRVVSSYREIDADSEPLTTSDGAQGGISRIALPTPDPLIVMNRDEEHPQSMALWRPTSGTIPGVEARLYVTERAYKGLYIMDLTEDGDGQWSFDFPDTGVTDNPGFFPLASQRVMNPSSFVANATSGPADIAIKQGTAPNYDDAMALVVIEAPAGTSTLLGTISVIALAPDPAPATPNPTELQAFLDTGLRFPTQHALSGRPDSAICEGDFATGFVGCEVDLDHDIDTGTRASPASLVSAVYFDCDGNGTADNVDNLTVPNAVDPFFVQNPIGNVIGGVTALTARPTGLPGDWRSQEPEGVENLNFATAGACAGSANPDSRWAYRADGTLELITKDFAPYRVEIPENLGAGERDDVALVSVRGDVAQSSANLNREWQPVYQMDIAAGAAPSIANNGAGGGVNLSVPAASAHSPYPVACLADLPHQVVLNTFGALDNPRQPDNLVSYPRASDLAVTVFDGAPGGGITHSLWGPDATADTPDDALFPGDVLIAKFAGQSHVYHFPITGVDGASNNTFYIRTDRCDFVPGGTVTEFRVIRTAKLIDFAPLSEIRSSSERDIPQGLLFSSVRTERTSAVTREDFKDFALLDDGVNVTGLVSFSTGGLIDAAGSTHVGAFDVLSCLDDSATRPSLLLGGCAALTTEQSNDPASPTPLHMESPNGAGAVLMAASSRFAYLLSSQTGEILAFRRTVGGSPDLVATVYPTMGLIGNGGFGASEAALSNPIGEISSFSSLRLGETVPDSRVLAINPHGSVTVLEEVVLGGEYIPRYDDTDDISGFSAINYPLIAAPGTGQSGIVLDGMVVGDTSSGFMGSVGGFVLPGRVGRESLASLGLIDFTGRAPVDLDPDTYQVDGLDTGGRAFVAFDFDPGRQQLFGILQTGLTDGYELRAWDLGGMTEVDLTTEVQGISCQSSGAGAKLSFTSAQSGTAIPTSIAARDGVVLIGFYSGGPSLAVVDTDNLLSGQFLAGLGCDLDIEDSAVLISLDAGSPADVQDVAIQGDLAFVAGSIGNSTHVLTALDMAPLWHNRGCGSFACLPRDLRGLQPGFTPDALSNPPVNLELHGNLLFVSTERGASGDGIEVFDVAPYSYGFAPPASPTASISYHAPDKVAILPTSLDVGGCAGRMSVGGSGLFVSDGRLRFEVAGGGPVDCDLDYVCPSGDPVEANLYVVNLASPTFNRASPPNLGVSCQRLGDPASELRDIIFLPPDPLP